MEIEYSEIDLQVGLDVACGSFDVGSNAGSVPCHNLVTNIVHKYVVVFAEGIDSLDILVQNIC